MDQEAFNSSLVFDRIKLKIDIFNVKWFEIESDISLILEW